MQYAKDLARSGIEPVFLPLLSDSYPESLYAGRRPLWETQHCYRARLAQIPAARACDLIWIEKELFPYIPAHVELLLLRGRPYVLDLDDAIFHTYDRSPSRLVRHMLGSKIDHLMAEARLVIAGNEYLEMRAIAAGAAQVEVLPSVVDLDLYRPTTGSIGRQGETLRVVWIGSPATVRYLDIVREPLQQLALTVPIELRVIGANVAFGPGLKCISIPWRAETEAREIRECDVGIMPLVDSPWERGKCGYKLIQYMAAGLPVVASAVGANTSIVTHEVDGFLAVSSDDWTEYLRRLAESAARRLHMGRAGREKVAQSYCVATTAPRLASLLTGLA